MITIFSHGWLLIRMLSNHVGHTEIYHVGGGQQRKRGEKAKAHFKFHTSGEGTGGGRRSRPRRVRHPWLGGPE